MKVRVKSKSRKSREWKGGSKKDEVENQEIIKFEVYRICRGDLAIFFVGGDL